MNGQGEEDAPGEGASRFLKRDELGELVARDEVTLDGDEGRRLARVLDGAVRVAVRLGLGLDDAEVDLDLLDARADVELCAQEAQDAEELGARREESGVRGEKRVLVHELEDGEVELGVGEREELDGRLDRVRVRLGEGRDGLVGEEGEDRVGLVVEGEGRQAPEAGEDEGAVLGARERDEEGEQADRGRVGRLGFGRRALLVSLLLGRDGDGVPG